jgi:large subunit ribosomal protein L10
MNRDEKAVVIDEIAGNITASQAIFAVDYRGITVPQAAELRDKLREVDASFRIVKNSLTERAADQAGVVALKELLAGPTALTFVRGDAATAAKAVADYARITQKLAFKGGVMDALLLTPEQVTQISRLPSRDILYGQLVGLVASPLTGLVRTLNALVGGLAIALAGVLEKKESGELPAGDPPAAMSAPSAEPTGADSPAAVEQPPVAAAEAPGADAPAAAATAATPDAGSDAPPAAAEPAEPAPAEEPAAAAVAPAEPVPAEEPAAAAPEATTSDSETSNKENT